MWFILMEIQVGTGLALFHGLIYQLGLMARCQNQPSPNRNEVA